jgi:mono/diheme cytochrome c family protein
MRFLLLVGFVLFSPLAFARESKEQRARRDLAARALLIALDDQSADAVEAASKSLSENLEPAGVPVFAPLKARLATLGAAFRAGKPDQAAVRAAIADTTAMFGVDTVPPLTPDLAGAQAAYRDQCRSCHGDSGAGDGILAKKVKGGVPSLVNAKSPFALYQRIAAGRAGTAMPGFDNRFDSEMLWALSYLCASFSLAAPAANPPLAPLLARGLSLDLLSRLDDAELAAWSGDAALLAFLRTRAPFLPAVPRFAKK